MCELVVGNKYWTRDRRPVVIQHRGVTEAHDADLSGDRVESFCAMRLDCDSIEYFWVDVNGKCFDGVCENDLDLVYGDSGEGFDKWNRMWRLGLVMLRIVFLMIIMLMFMRCGDVWC